MEKPKQIEYYRKVLEAVSSKCTCSKRKVGAIIVKDKTIISTGYNGSPRGLEHCDDVGHLEGIQSMNFDRKTCIRTVHSEVNAIITAARNGIPIEGCDMYSIYKPCFQCMKVIINSGIKNCYYFGDYRDANQKHFENNPYTKFIKINEPNLETCVES